MGFPLGYSDLLFSKLLGHLWWLISWVFNAVGLRRLLVSNASSPESHHHHHPEFLSVSAMLIQELLPVVRYEDLVGANVVAAGECAVCLYEFEGAEEVRRLSNCWHVFHRCCLDRWIEHGHRTCPLCRAPLFPEDMMVLDDGFYDRVWAAAGIPDSYEDNVVAGEYSSFLPFVSSSSPLLIVPQHLVSSR